MKPTDYVRAKALIDSKQMTLPEWAKGFATFNGETAAHWEKEYVASRLMEAQGKARVSLAKMVASYKVPQKFVRILRLQKTFSAEFNTDARIVFELSQDGQSAQAVLLNMKKKKTRSTGGESKGRKSAWVAYQEGQDMSDTFTIEKTGKRGIYCDTTDSSNPVEIDRKNGGLCGYIRRAWPNSDAAKILYKFGYDRLTG